MHLSFPAYAELRIAGSTPEHGLEQGLWLLERVEEVSARRRRAISLVRSSRSMAGNS
jgi:hypothetical protein